MGKLFGGSIHVVSFPFGAFLVQQKSTIFSNFRLRAIYAFSCRFISLIFFLSLSLLFVMGKLRIRVFQPLSLLLSICFLFSVSVVSTELLFTYRFFSHVYGYSRKKSPRVCAYKPVLFCYGIYT